MIFPFAASLCVRGVAVIGRKGCFTAVRHESTTILNQGNPAPGEAGKVSRWLCRYGPTTPNKAALLQTRDRNGGMQTKASVKNIEGFPVRVFLSLLGQHYCRRDGGATERLFSVAALLGRGITSQHLPPGTRIREEEQQHYYDYYSCYYHLLH